MGWGVSHGLGVCHMGWGCVICGKGHLLVEAWVHDPYWQEGELRGVVQREEKAHLVQIQSSYL